MKNHAVNVYVKTNVIKEDHGQEGHELSHLYDSDLPIDLTKYRTMLYILFDICRSREYKVNTSLRGIYERCNLRMTRNYKQSKNYKLICDAINLLVEESYITPLDRPIDEYDANESISITLGSDNGDWDPIKRYSESLGYDVINEPFIYINSDIFDKLAAAKINYLPNLLHTYLHLAALTPRRSKIMPVEEQPKCFWYGQNNLAQVIGVSPGTVVKYIHMLEDMGLIHTDSIGISRRGFASPTIYTLDCPDWQAEMEAGKERFSKKYRSFIKKLDDQEDWGQEFEELLASEQ